MGLFNLLSRAAKPAVNVTPEIPSDAEGQYRLGFRYASGQGVPKDLVNACKWLTLAADQGHEPASEMKNMLAERMTREEIAEADRRAKAFIPHREPVY